MELTYFSSKRAISQLKKFFITDIAKIIGEYIKDIKSIDTKNIIVIQVCENIIVYSYPEYEYTPILSDKLAYSQYFILNFLTGKKIDIKPPDGYLFDVLSTNGQSVFFMNNFGQKILRFHKDEPPIGINDVKNGKINNEGNILTFKELPRKIFVLNILTEKKYCLIFKEDISDFYFYDDFFYVIFENYVATYNLKESLKPFNIKRVINSNKEIYFFPNKLFFFSFERNYIRIFKHKDKMFDEYIFGIPLKFSSCFLFIYNNIAIGYTNGIVKMYNCQKEYYLIHKGDESIEELRFNKNEKKLIIRSTNKVTIINMNFSFLK